MLACSRGTLTNVLPGRKAILRTQDMTPPPPPRHSIQRHGQPGVVLFIEFECHTGIHNYPDLGLDPTGKSFHDLPHTPANAQLYDAVMVVVSQKLSRKSTIPNLS